jgi:hypothetical protein
MDEYMKLLGCKVRDLVTGFEGVVSSISFDLYGCIQVIVTPFVDKDGKLGEGRWFDSKRLVVTDRTPVMAVPKFEAVPGGQILPDQIRCEPVDSNPIR